jgi:aspartate 1-decarboxylase
MNVRLLRSKLHRLTITGVYLDYEGSLELDSELISAAGMYPYEQVDVLNLRNGERLTTYLIPGEAGSGVCRLNGPAALRGAAGDLVIVVAYADLSPEEAAEHSSVHVYVNEKNELQRSERRG